MATTKIDEIRGKDEITRRVISQLEALRNSPLGQTQDGRPLPQATMARMEVPGYRLELIDGVEYVEWTGPTSLIELLLKASAGQNTIFLETLCTYEPYCVECCWPVSRLRSGRISTTSIE